MFEDNLDTKLGSVYEDSGTLASPKKVVVERLKIIIQRKSWLRSCTHFEELKTVEIKLCAVFKSHAHEAYN